MADYQKTCQGGFVFEVFCVRNCHYSSTRNMGSTPEAGQLHKIMLGWNLATFARLSTASQTYIPIKWDLSDLQEKCLYYLEHPAETREITSNAIRMLNAYFNSDAECEMIFYLVTQNEKP